MTPADNTSPLSWFTHAFVPGYPRAARTLVLLHGGTGNENDMLPLGRELDGAAAILSLKGPILEGGLPRFFSRQGKMTIDLASLKETCRRMSQFLAAAATHYSLPPAANFLVGYSDGATAAVAALLLYPDQFSGAILLRPLIPFLPQSLRSLSGKRVWIGAARNDSYAPLEQGEILHSLFANAGAEVSLYASDSGHAIRANEFALVREWVKRGDAGVSPPSRSAIAP